MGSSRKDKDNDSKQQPSADEQQSSAKSTGMWEDHRWDAYYKAWRRDKVYPPRGVDLKSLERDPDTNKARQSSPALPEVHELKIWWDKFQSNWYKNKKGLLRFFTSKTIDTSKANEIAGFAEALCRRLDDAEIRESEDKELAEMAAGFGYPDQHQRRDENKELAAELYLDLAQKIILVHDNIVLKNEQERQEMMQNLLGHAAYALKKADSLLVSPANAEKYREYSAMLKVAQDKFTIPKEDSNVSFRKK